MKISSFLVFCFVFSYSSLACASGWISGQVTFWDERTNRSDTGIVVLNSDMNTNMPLSGVKIDIFDLDGSCRDSQGGCTEDDDDFLTSVITNENGEFSAYVEGLVEPYYRFTFSNTYGKVLGEDGLPVYVYSGLLSTDLNSNITRDFSVVCWYNLSGVCTSDPNYLEAHDLQSRAQILQTIYETAKFFEDNDVIDINNNHNSTFSNGFISYYPNSPDGKCDNATATSWGYQYFCISESRADENHVVSHEMGHNLHRRAMSYPTSLAAGSCASSYDWSTNTSFEKCVTSEGFASFVAAVVHFSRGDFLAYYQTTTRRLEGATIEGNSSLQSCVSSSQSPHRVIGNVSRWMWDLYDTTVIQETSSQDNATFSFEDIVSNWSNFPGGIMNRQNGESSVNGRNAYDFTYYMPLAVSERNLNCLGGQAP